MARSVPCASCGSRHESRGAFCSPCCRAVAEFVRTCRSWLRDPARQADPHYPYALQVRLGFLNAELLGHGTVYDEKARYLNQAQKAAIWERDQGLCVQCGMPGAEIDHISSSSSDTANLQLLCMDCHHAKTLRAMAPVTDAADREALHSSYAELARRIDAPRPLRACDNEQTWRAVWRKWPDVDLAAMAYTGAVPTLTVADLLHVMAAASAD